MVEPSGLKPNGRPPAEGLIEGATPECRGPLQVVRYQRAQDQLLSQCARLAEVDGEFSLVKNDRDAAGNVYGAQENYEADSRHGLVALVLACRAGTARTARGPHDGGRAAHD